MQQAVFLGVLVNCNVQEQSQFQSEFVLERCWICGSQMGLYKQGAYRKGGEGLFTRVCSDRTKGNGCKLKEGRFRLDIRKKFFTMRVVRHWNRFPREAINAPSLEVFKARLDGALSNLV